MQEKQLSMGCPQRPVHGLTLWIVLFDSLLRLRLPQGCHLYAYADDGMLLVEAASRRELERKASVACDMIYDWCEVNRLELSIAKTKCMLLKLSLIHI